MTTFRLSDYARLLELSRLTYPTQEQAAELAALSALFGEQSEEDRSYLAPAFRP